MVHRRAPGSKHRIVCYADLGLELLCGHNISAAGAANAISHTLKASKKKALLNGKKIIQILSY